MFRYKSEKGVGIMRKLLGHLALVAALGVLLVTSVGGEARGGPMTMLISIEDVTISTTVLPPTPILKAGPFDASNIADPNSLITNGTFDTLTTAVGLQLSGITAISNNPGSLTSATISVGGTAQVVPGVATSGHTFEVTILASQTFFTGPPLGGAKLGDSESFTLTNTTGKPGDKQDIKSFYDKTNTLLNTGAGTISTAGISLALPASPLFPPVSSPMNSEVTGVSPYSIPYSLTTELVITITGNAASPNAKDVFGGATSLVASAVPEPASAALLLTGMPITVVVLALRRRRRKAAAKS
jgi:hypothetical protein